MTFFAVCRFLLAWAVVAWLLLALSSGCMFDLCQPVDPVDPAARHVPGFWL